MIVTFPVRIVQHLIQVKKHFQQKQNQSVHVQSAADTAKFDIIMEKPSKPVISKQQVVEKNREICNFDRQICRMKA